MRALGIEAAKDLQQFAEHLIDHGNLVADCSSYSYILRALQPSGSIIKYLAGRMARQMSTNMLELSPA
jgi:sulfur transfer protein SufE